VIKFFRKIQNIGVVPNTNLGVARRIRLGNTMSTLGISTGVILLFYAYLANWPLSVFIIHSFVVVATFVPPVLIVFRKGKIWVESLSSNGSRFYFTIQKKS